MPRPSPSNPRIGAFAKLLDAIPAGKTYVNIHTTKWTGGEIRTTEARTPRLSPLPARPQNIRVPRLVSYIVSQGITGARGNWQEQLRRGALDFAILLAVSPGPKYGLALIQYLEKFTDLVVSEGTIYPILGRLTRDELLHAWWVEDEAPHARKYYRLTPAGKRRLAEMKAEWSAFADKIARLMQAAEGSGNGAE